MTIVAGKYAILAVVIIVPTRYCGDTIRPCGEAGQPESCMERLPPSPEWVIAESEDLGDEHLEFVQCAKNLWPRVLSYARRQDRGRVSLEEKEPLAAEIWECVLRSVARTRVRLEQRGERIANLEAYLIGAFQHRFNRALKREKERRLVVEFVAAGA